MQTDDKKFYSQNQKKILSILWIAILLCIIFASFGNIRTLKNIENDNSFSKNPALLHQKSDLIECGVEKGEYVHIGGYPIGISVKAEGLIVADVGSVKTKSGDACPLKNTPIANGDIILSLDGEKVSSIYRLKEIISKSKGGVVDIEYIKNGKVLSNKVQAIKDVSGDYKLGLSLKEDVGGIGTMTFVTQKGNFASLGHYVQDADTMLKDELQSGNVFKANISGVSKGEKGKTGGLIGDVNRLSTSIGCIKRNDEIGLYGIFDSEIEGDLYRIAKKGEAKMGKAQVLTTIDGAKPKFYDIEIVKVISQSTPQEKGMVILVSDKELLERTGGIVQGMSGSPIIQNGILIGAITHVFLQDPTRGYAVHARFMYDVANSVDKNAMVCEKGFLDLVA